MIESVHNSKAKRWVELQQKKGREKYGAFLIEGVRLVEDALQSNAPVEAVIWQGDKTFPFLAKLPPSIEQWQVSEAVMKKISTTEQSQGIVAVVAMERKKVKDFDGDLLLLVDGVQDPGNLGTIIRTADAAGVDMVILGEGTVDLYNPKTVRSTMGSLFHLPIVSAPLTQAIADLKNKGVAVIASSLATDRWYDQVQYGQRVALIVGNEGSGIRQEILALADQLVKIPIYGKAESLNVSVATALMLYEIRKSMRT